MLEAGGVEPPRLVLFSTENADALVTALALGADDALVAPVHFPELCARLARPHSRPPGSHGAHPYETEVRETLRDLVAEARHDAPAGGDRGGPGPAADARVLAGAVLVRCHGALARRTGRSWPTSRPRSREPARLHLARLPRDRGSDPDPPSGRAVRGSSRKRQRRGGLATIAIPVLRRDTVPAVCCFVAVSPSPGSAPPRSRWPRVWRRWPPRRSTGRRGRPPPIGTRLRPRWSGPQAAGGVRARPAVFAHVQPRAARRSGSRWRQRQRDCVARCLGSSCGARSARGSGGAAASRFRRPLRRRRVRDRAAGDRARRRASGR